MENFFLKLHKGYNGAFYKKEAESFFKSKSLFDQFKKGYKDFDSKLLNALFLRQLLQVQNICKGYPKHHVIDTSFEAIKKYEYAGVDDFETDGRLAIGLGNTSIFETSMTLHHVYGFPYIPASSIKGILRSWVIREYFPLNDNDKDDLINAESNALGDKSFCLLFGCSKEKQTIVIGDDRQPVMKGKKIYKKKNESTELAKDHIGNIVFFDAYPTEPPCIEVDIMNPHYQEYYKEGSDTPPADWQNPVPIYFLTVKSGTPFQFLFGYRKGISENEYKYLQHITLEHPTSPDLTKEGTAIEVLSALLREALEENGIGAKTAVDYGKMNSKGEKEKAKWKAKEERKKEEAIKQAKLKAEEKERKLQEKIEIEDWNSAKKNNTIEGFTQFIEAHPRSKYKEEALKFRAKLKVTSGIPTRLEELKDWKRFSKEASSWIKKLPEGEFNKFSSQFESLILPIAKSEIKNKRTAKVWHKSDSNVYKKIKDWLGEEKSTEIFNKLNQ